MTVAQIIFIVGLSWVCTAVICRLSDWDDYGPRNMLEALFIYAPLVWLTLGALCAADYGAYLVFGLLG